MLTQGNHISALKDVLEVIREEPDNFTALCTKVADLMLHFFISSVMYFPIFSG